MEYILRGKLWICSNKFLIVCSLIIPFACVACSDYDRPSWFCCGFVPCQDRTVCKRFHFFHFFSLFSQNREKRITRIAEFKERKLTFSNLEERSSIHYYWEKFSIFMAVYISNRCSFVEWIVELKFHGMKWEESRFLLFLLEPFPEKWHASNYSPRKVGTWGNRNNKVFNTVNWIRRNRDVEHTSPTARTFSTRPTFSINLLANVKKE